METAKLKKFAQFARRSLIEQVSTKLKLVLAENSAARRENAEAIIKLDDAIHQHSKEQVIERVAYIWFNRFCALRFMDVNRYTRIGVVSTAEGQFQPEILAEAKMGHIDDEIVNDKTRQQIFALLDGKIPSRDPQGEAYRLLVVGACNQWHRAMPFLFERIDDYTELLMPDDLLSVNSILANTRETMTPDACQDVEVIGWLYQFYISEKKGEVFDGLKKNKKITPENIPAATQLFTPHWIVRYLVENSLGRLWMLNRPNSRLIEQMDYYIKPEQPETDFLRISRPEDIKVCDPACGSGHMLTYAFDLLYAIYEEEGVDPAEIPSMILTHNLYGIEIDERAGELAAFALTMKARARQRRFFHKGIVPNICVLENIHFDKDELSEYMDFVGQDLFTAPLQTTLRQFEESDNFGSLIRPDVTDVIGVLQVIEAKDVSGQLFLSETHKKVLQSLQQADYLSPKYHVVVANPPYMGGKGMNGRLGAWAKDNYPDSKSDLFAAFIERGLDLIRKRGFSAMVTMESWMFLSSFEKVRTKLLVNTTILSMVHMPYLGKGGTSMGINFGTTAFVIENLSKLEFQGQYCCIRYFETDDSGVPREFPPQNERLSTASSADFKKIPGSPIAYWVSDELIAAFAKSEELSQRVRGIQGIITGDNNAFLRYWPEVSRQASIVPPNCFDPNKRKSSYWIPYAKGGDFRRWYGNNEYLLYWQDEGKQLTRRRSENSDLYFRPCISWNKISTKTFAARYLPQGYVWDVAGSSVFPNEGSDTFFLVALLCSKVAEHILASVSPTLNFEMETILAFPFLKQLEQVKDTLSNTAEEIVRYSRSDWDAYETSWDFNILPIIHSDYRQSTLKATYQKLRAHWQEMTVEMQCLEEENNRIFIEVYGLHNELTPEMPLKEITLTCNPRYRYGGNKNDEELEALLLADTMREFISYAVGCMFGRYALDKPGLILANQGETLYNYLKLVPEPSFLADHDNVLPMLDGDWFTDDIAERFRKFLRIAFGEEHYEDNLKFIETALGKNSKPRDIRDYFLKDFYNDHVRRYKKRPIYWLFSSSNGSFNALIYMHRYRPDTVSVVLNDYLREFRTKLASHKNHLEAVSISASASQGEKTKALKEIEKTNKMIVEIEEYEREVLYPLATEQMEIDLDDGVKVNYLKLGAALKKIPGLDSAEE